MRLSRQFFAGLFAGCLLTILCMAGLDKGFWNNRHTAIPFQPTSPVTADTKTSGSLSISLEEPNMTPVGNTFPLAGQQSTPEQRPSPEHQSESRQHATAGQQALPNQQHSVSQQLSGGQHTSSRQSTIGQKWTSGHPPPASADGPEKTARLLPSFPLPDIISAITFARHTNGTPQAEQTGQASQTNRTNQITHASQSVQARQAHNGPMFKSTPNKFSFHCMGTGDGPTLLVIGGIQGDEPGGFSAASLLSTHYAITHGNLWIVPDLNFASIVKRNRGLFGDMNRKFAHLAADDPEYELVQGIKTIMLAEEVDLVLNLHDGSGFYCPTWVNTLRNPNRWGQSVIIDKVEMDAPRFNMLHHMASRAEKDANKALVHPDHRYFIRNTNTHLGDKEMEKSLSWFAVLNGKPAFGIEASKEFTTEYRSYYHMLIVESFMRQMGIEFERNFDLSPKSVLVALNSNLTLSLYDGKIILPLDDVRPQLNNVPFADSIPPNHQASRPLLSLVKERDNWRVAYGNRTLTRITPETMPFDHSLHTMTISIDGRPTAVDFGAIIPVKKDFMVHHEPGYRVNAIGATREVNGTEAGVTLCQADFMERFSVDKKGLLYRVEVYKDDAFCGMVLVDFGTSYQPPALGAPLTAVRGEESELGY